MDAPTGIVGVFLFLSIGFLQVPGALNGDSSTFCAHTGACRNVFDKPNGLSKLASTLSWRENVRESESFCLVARRINNYKC